MSHYGHVKVGFLGSGNMAQALSKGFISAGHIKGNNIIASHTGTTEQRFMKELGAAITLNNREVVQKSQVLFLAVKPHFIETVLKEVVNDITKDHLVLSLAAGHKLATLETMLPAGTRLARVMPNTPSQVSCGATVFCTNDHMLEEDIELVSTLFSSIGTCDKIPERLMDAVNGLSGSGPAYVYVAIEALSDGAVKMGVPRAMATKLAAQTLMGAAKMVLETGQHPGALKDGVTSPGGTTICALHELEKGGFRASLISAVEASANKSKQIADG